LIVRILAQRSVCSAHSFVPACVCWLRFAVAAFQLSPTSFRRACRGRACLVRGLLLPAVAVRAGVSAVRSPAAALIERATPAYVADTPLLPQWPAQPPVPQPMAHDSTESSASTNNSEPQWPWSVSGNSSRLGSPSPTETMSTGAGVMHPSSSPALLLSDSEMDDPQPLAPGLPGALLTAGAKRRADVLESASDEQISEDDGGVGERNARPAKRALVEQPQLSAPMAAGAPLHPQYRHAVVAPHPPVASGFVPAPPADAICFREPTAFAKKHVSTPALRAAQTQLATTAALPQVQMSQPAAAAVTAEVAAPARSLFGVSAPVLQMDGVRLVPFNPTAAPVPSVAVPLPIPAPRPRFKLQCPPTPVHTACRPVNDESTTELFSNRLLMRRGKRRDGMQVSGCISGIQAAALSSVPLDDDLHSLCDGEAAAPLQRPPTPVDIHASPTFTATRTYASSNPFAHSNARHGGPFIFERHFRNHKCVGSGAFFEVFRAEAVEPLSDTPAPAAEIRRRIYAIKKSLRPFHSEYDRHCLLRETNILALLNDTLVQPPELSVVQPAAEGASAAIASAAAASIAAVSTAAPSAPPSSSIRRPHPNPHLIRWHQTWQEAGFFFEQLQYCSMSLAEFVFVLMETPPTEQQVLTRPSQLPMGLQDAAQQPPAPFPLSYFQQHLPRLFLSLLVQMCLSLYTLHSLDVVHLDIKPANFLLCRHGAKVLLSDFGLARRLDETDERGQQRKWTLEDELEGDCTYMSPELLSAPDADETAPDSAMDASSGSSSLSTKADLFSLGMLLFELVTNSELPQSGFLWQRLRHGGVTDYLPQFDEEPAEAALAAVAASSNAFSASAVTTPEAHEFGVTVWMTRVIANLLSPHPRHRMSAAELLVACEDKLTELGWIAADPTRTSTHVDAEAVSARAAHLAFEWTSALPACLELPSLSSLNTTALLDRAREMNFPPATPTPAGSSPAPFQFGVAVRGPSPGPLMRQRSSPSPSRSGGFFASSSQQPRLSPVPFPGGLSASAGAAYAQTPGTPSGLPPSPWSLRMFQSESSRASLSSTPLRLQRRFSSAHHMRSASFTLDGANFSAPLAEGTPPSSVRLVDTDRANLQRSGQLPRAVSPATPLEPSGAPWSVAAMPPMRQPSPSEPRQPVGTGAAVRRVAPLNMPSIALVQQRGIAQPLSPLRLNSPARRITDSPSTGAPSRPQQVSLLGRPSSQTTVAAFVAPFRDPTLGASGAPSGVRPSGGLTTGNLILSSSMPSLASVAVPAAAQLNVSSAVETMSSASSVSSLMTPPPVPRTLASSSMLFSSLASASAASPPSSPSVMGSGTDSVLLARPALSSTACSLFAAVAANAVTGGALTAGTAAMAGDAGLGGGVSMFAPRAPVPLLHTQPFAIASSRPAFFSMLPGNASPLPPRQP